MCPADFRQLSPWMPAMSTYAPQTQRSAAQTGAPGRVAMATRSLPIADLQIACRNAPAHGAETADTAIRRATAAWFDADDNRTVEAVATSGRSRAFFRLLNGGALV